MASSGAGMLSDATKQLLVAWKKTQRDWDDQRSREFAKRYLEPMEPRVRSALAAIDELDAAIAAAKRECA